MNNILIVLMTLMSATSFASADDHHFDLEMSSQEYREVLKEQQLVAPFESVFFNATLANSVRESLRAGERLFTWLELINANRPEDKKIRLTSKKTRKGIPITKPSRYGPVRIEQRMNKIVSEIPEAMKSIIYKGQAATADPGVDDQVFIEFGRKVDRLYQTASRWSLLKPYKAAYSLRRAQDVRGYYFLNENGWDATRISNEWGTLKDKKLEEVRNALYGICLNSGTFSGRCRSQADALSSSSSAVSFYRQNIAGAEKTWNKFFDIRNPRRDITWVGADATVATVPFYDPKDQAVRDFLKGNIDDEFQWGDWGLQLNFVERKPAPYIIFEAGATPHVNGLGGNEITMDANKSIDEYEVQWVIRHEFGHVLGIPDCYHEFYDQENDEFVNYQIDTTDLMCSRAGNMNERIYEQMKEAYAQ